MNICVVLFLLFFCRRTGGCEAAGSSGSCCGHRPCECCDPCAVPVQEVCRPVTPCRQTCSCESSCEEGCGCTVSSGSTESACCTESLGGTEEECRPWRFMSGSSLGSGSNASCPLEHGGDASCNGSRNHCR